MKKLILTAMMVTTSLVAQAGGAGSENSFAVRAGRCVSEDKQSTLDLYNVENRNGLFVQARLDVKIKKSLFAVVVQNSEAIQLPQDILSPVSYSLAGATYSNLSTFDIVDGRVNANVQISLLPQRAATTKPVKSYAVDMKIRSASNLISVKKVFTCK